MGSRQGTQAYDLPRNRSMDRQTAEHKHRRLKVPSSYGFRMSSLSRAFVYVCDKRERYGATIKKKSNLFRDGHFKYGKFHGGVYFLSKRMSNKIMFFAKIGFSTLNFTRKDAHVPINTL